MHYKANDNYVLLEVECFKLLHNMQQNREETSYIIPAVDNLVLELPDSGGVRGIQSLLQDLSW